MSKSHMDQLELNKAVELMSWNKRLLTTLGLWPNEPSNIRFILTFGYFLYHMILEYLDLILFIGSLEHVIMNLTENMAFSQIVIRIAMLRQHNNRLGVIINDAFNDFNAENYRSSEEIQCFLKYNARSRHFVKLLIAFVVLTASSYYLKPVMSYQPGELSNAFQTNGSAVYGLPYRFHLFYRITNYSTYILTYISHLPFVFISGFGQSAADCLMVTLVFHVCGQLAVLAIRIRNININGLLTDKELRNIIKYHHRLLQMGQTIADAFSETLLGHLIGATSLVCILGYQVLTNYANGQNADLATFMTFAFLVMLVLYAHCVVGESLLAESLNVCDAFYDCKWYDMPAKDARILVICMARSQRPLCLTAGKFGVFSLSTITIVLKTSMGYLSVLRSLL